MTQSTSRAVLIQLGLTFAGISVACLPLSFYMQLLCCLLISAVFGLGVWMGSWLGTGDN